MHKVNEQSTAYVAVTFYDKDGVTADPNSATYDLVDVISGERLKDGVVLSTVSGVGEIIVDKTDTTLKDATAKEELRRITVHGIYGASDEIHDTYYFQVVALADVPIA